MINELMIITIALPVVFGVLELLVSEKLKFLTGKLTFISTLAGLVIAGMLFGKVSSFTYPWAFGFDFAFRLYQFSGFILLAVAAFAFLITLYSLGFMADKAHQKQHYAYMLFTLALVNGAVLSDNIFLMLFFWEGLLLTLFGMIAIGGKESYKTAVKAFLIAGVTDVCMMFGIALAVYLGKTSTMSAMSIPLTGLGAVAFIFIMIGAISKAGSMPFHTWIPDAAVDAPLPFMAFLPASLEKLLGIYLLARISLDIFQLNAFSWVSTMLMVIGVITILLAVMMALVQKDYKKLLSYHAISQVGYMILGIGTMVPAGIVGGLFHMINHAMYKSCLFLTGGSVEKQAGTTDLSKLGGIGKSMPITFVCFVIAAAAISGMPPFNGFFSKELVYDGALERGMGFYLLAVLGSFLTAASFLKLGHAAFLGKQTKESSAVKESSWGMLIPMMVIAAGCILFGVYNALPLNHFIQPIVGELRLEGHNFSGFHANILLVAMTIIVLAAAYINHMYGVKKTGKGLGAVDHIHYAPGLSEIYTLAERRFFDPYDFALKVVAGVARVSWWLDRSTDWFYSRFSVDSVYALGGFLRKKHDGSYSRYITWSMVGAVVILWILI